MNKERLSKLAEDLLEIPSRVFEIQVRILDYTEQIKTTTNEILLIEANLKSSIAAELNNEGKKLYPNAESRESAFIELSNDNLELTEKRNYLSSLNGFVAIEKIKIESLNNEQRNIRAVLHFFGGYTEDIL